MIELREGERVCLIPSADVEDADLKREVYIGEWVLI